jgi:hypothetical protein
VLLELLELLNWLLDVLASLLLDELLLVELPWEFTYVKLNLNTSQLML